MSLDELDISDSPESWKNSTEISEKYKETVKKAGAWIRRTQKDEWKQKRYDFLLAKFLVELILKKRYDFLLDKLFVCLDAGYGTNFLLGILSLVYLPISHEIRKASWKEELKFSYHISLEPQEFDETQLPEEIRQRVNDWIDDMVMVSSFETSTIIATRNLNLILYDEKIREFASDTFQFFFGELNIHISHTKSYNYSEFILWELQKKVRNVLPEMRAKDEWEEGEI